jgi:hypothetical protein
LLPRRRLALATFVVASAMGCDRPRDLERTGEAQAQVESRSRVAGLVALATACDETANSRVADRLEWIVPSERDVMSPIHSITTTDIVRARDGSLVVLDGPQGRITQLSPQGAKLREWTRREGNGPGEFIGAKAVAVGPNDRVYVSDSRGRVHVFSSSGEFIRTIQITGISGIRDLGVFDDGRMLVAAPVRLSPGHGKTYVAIVDSNGSLLREVLAVERDHSGGMRPLLAPFNPVHVSMSPSGDFAVWYPLDNFVEVFNSTGDVIQTIKGCMPDELAAHYTQLTRSAAAGQSFVILTLGVSLDSNGGVDVIARYTIDGVRIVRNLRYDPNSATAIIRDLEPAPGGLLGDRSVRLDRSAFAVYYGIAPDGGIRKLVFH